MGRFSQTTSAAAAVPRPTASPASTTPDEAPRAKPDSSDSGTRHAQVLLDAKIRVHNRLIDELDLSSLEKLGDSDLKRQVRAIVMEIVREEGMAMSSAEIGLFADAVFDEMTGLGPIEPLLADDSVSDILINGPFQVYVERGGELELSSVRFADNAHLLRILNRIVSAVGRRVDESQPLVDARLLDGSRVNAAISPIGIGKAPNSANFSIVSGFFENFRMETSAPSMPMLNFVVGAVKCRASTVISGGTGSGKTTLLNALSSAISHKERIITIEDAAELQLQQPHVARMETRPPNLEGKGEIRQRELVKNALRMRPDRVFLGEVRGEEAFDMLQAMNTGHEGSMATIHANNPRDALTRLEQMVLMGGMKISVEAIRGQIASAVNLIVQAARLSDGSRRVMSVAEIVGMEGDVIQLQEIFKFERTHTDDDGKVHGKFVATGLRPKFLEEMQRRGVHIPVETFDPQREF
ncbi:MAG: CpaF family protein [Pseudomonadota bacterium]